MRRAALLLTACCLAGCGGSRHHVAVSASGSCAAAVVRGGATYFGTRVTRAAQAGASLGDGQVPPCRDTSPATSAEPAQTVELTAIRGVAPDLAVLVAGTPRVVYVAAGTFPQLDSHPLHALFYGWGGGPDERAPWCDERRTVDLSGTVAHPGFGSIPLEGRSDPVFVDVHTRFTGPQRIERGEHLRIHALECRHAGDAHYRKLIALTVEPD